MAPYCGTQVNKSETENNVCMSMTEQNDASRQPHFTKQFINKVIDRNN